MASDSKEGAKLWGGRFSGKTDPVFEKFNASIGFDKNLWQADLLGSKAYAAALERASVISGEENKAIQDGLDQVAAEWEANTFVIKRSDEDIHTANERRLGELIGAPAGKLHTGRSRNDQVATDLRLWLAGETRAIRTAMAELVNVACSKAEREIDVIMPGFTHLQPAQPVRWSHFLLSYAWSWRRDCERFGDALSRTLVLPLGSGALAGNPFGIDRQFLVDTLGFKGMSGNSLDAVSDRDFVAETLFAASLTMTHISQWAEDLIIFCSKKYVTCADAYSTGSSLMPQKKNPDALELLRGKCARVSGALVSLLMLLKGLPRAYNKDLQEDKEVLFDAVAQLRASLEIAAGVLATLTVHPGTMKTGLTPEMLATDLAEYLVKRGVPFRESHHVSGAAVKLAETRKCSLFDLTAEDLRSLHPAFADDVIKIWDYEASVESRSSVGGTSKSSCLRQIAELSEWAKAI